MRVHGISVSISIVRALGLGASLACLQGCHSQANTTDAGQDATTDRTFDVASETSSPEPDASSDAPRATQDVTDVTNCATPDRDSDGHLAMACGGDDCDDNDPNRYPGRAEVCDSIHHDEDCDLATFGVRDEDRDSYSDVACCNVASNGTRRCGNDCNDRDTNIHPMQTESCNGVDDNCAGGVDEGVLRTFYPDEDGDGSGSTRATATMGCTAPANSVETDHSDCDDSLATVEPGAPERCDGIDNDCDEMTDEEPDANAMCNTGLRCMGGVCGGVLEVTPASSHTCALRSNGTVWCWGSNAYGQLGIGDENDRLFPVLTVTGLTDVAQVASAGQYSCARRRNGTVTCWGNDEQGQLGDGPAAPDAGVSYRSTPVAVLGLTDAVEVAVGPTHGCARRMNGTVSCWGDNGDGQLGDGSTVALPMPVAVTGLTGITNITAGGVAGETERRGHSCARRMDGTVWCWGNNISGQLGDGTTTTSGTPVQVMRLTDAVEVDAGGSFTCARRAGGTVVCWGWNVSGQLGDGIDENTRSEMRPAPGAVVGLTDAVQLSVGQIHACARRAGGTVVCWGSNAWGQLGSSSAGNSSEPTPVPVSDLPDATLIASGALHNCARRAGGAVVCWGDNSNAQIGDGTRVNAYTPSAVMRLP